MPESATFGSGTSERRERFFYNYNKRDDTGSISFTEISRYLGSITHYSPTSGSDVDYRISKASAAFGALSL
jgi:hypothetical protein